MALNIDGTDEEQRLTNNWTLRRVGNGAPDKCPPWLSAQNKKIKIDLLNNMSGIFSIDLLFWSFIHIFPHIFGCLACELMSDEPKYEEVVENSKKVLEMDPTNFKAHSRLAKALFQLQDLHGALEACDQAVRHLPKDHTTSIQ